MSDTFNRRQFPIALGGSMLLTGAIMADEPKKPTGPTEAEFTRDYPAPTFKPSWKKPQLNRTLVQDFVIFAHSDLAMTKQLLMKEPALINAVMDWGGGDWESALGAAAHMGNREIALFLLESGARMDLFASAMLGQLDIVKAMLALQPKLIDAKGPHGFSLHWHANAGGTDATKVLDYLQSVKKVELPKFPMKK